MKKDKLNQKLVNKLSDLLNEQELMPAKPNGGGEQASSQEDLFPPALTTAAQPQMPLPEEPQKQAELITSAQAAQPEPSKEPAMDQNPSTILYIEDNGHNRRIVRKILEHQGYEVQEAEDGLEGYEMIRDLQPPLVLLDIALPTIDGLEILRRLQTQENEHLQDIPVIALTASAMRGDRERFLEAGCSDYLSKPIRAADLINMVKHHHPHHAA